MSNIKTQHLGGDRASKPSLAPGHHKQQVPGDATGNPSSSMRWEKREMNASKATARKHRGE